MIVRLSAFHCYDELKKSSRIYNQGCGSLKTHKGDKGDTGPAGPAGPSGGSGSGGANVALTMTKQVLVVNDNVNDKVNDNVNVNDSPSKTVNDTFKKETFWNKLHLK